jgi:DNA-directed RNA polymerase subunit L
MNLEKIRFEENVLEFNIDGEDHTLLNLLREQLSELSEVQFAAYKLVPHERPIFYVRTEPDENPVDIVSLASKNIITQCNKLIKQIKKI